MLYVKRLRTDYFFLLQTRRGLSKPETASSVCECEPGQEGQAREASNPNGLENRLLAPDYNLKAGRLTSSQDEGSRSKKDGLCTWNPSPKPTQSSPPFNVRASAHMRADNTNIITLFTTRNRSSSFFVCGKHGKFSHIHSSPHIKREKKKDTILDFL